MKKGFTLIELLIVITIIGILAVAFLPSLMGAPAKARDAQRTADVGKIAAVLTNSTISGTVVEDGCTNDNSVVPALVAADFGGKIPVDPVVDNAVGTCSTGYAVVTDTSDPKVYNFGVFAHLEVAGQGNVECTDGAIADPIGGITLGKGDGFDCYAVLIQ